MGYTHYWTPASFTEEQWKGVMADVIKTLDHESFDDLLCYEYDKPNTPPEVSREFIRFNGKLDDGHETFLYRNDGGWAFCKTARKGYDTAVCAVLVVIAYHCKLHDLDFTISSDGRWSEWNHGRAIAFEATGYQMDNFIDD